MWWFAVAQMGNSRAWDNATIAACDKCSRMQMLLNSGSECHECKVFRLGAPCLRGVVWGTLYVSRKHPISDGDHGRDDGCRPTANHDG